MLVIMAVVLQGLVLRGFSQQAQFSSSVSILQAGVVFFVSNMSQRLVQTMATVPSFQDQQSPQDRVTPAVNFLTSDGIIHTFDQQQFQQENSSQGSQQPENEQSGTSTVGERVGDDFLKFEYDYSCFSQYFYEYEQGLKNILQWRIGYRNIYHFGVILVAMNLCLM